MVLESTLLIWSSLPEILEASSIFNHLIPWRNQFYVLNLFPFSFPVPAGTVIKAPGEDRLSLPTPESSLRIGILAMAWFGFDLSRIEGIISVDLCYNRFQHFPFSTSSLLAPNLHWCSDIHVNLGKIVRLMLKTSSLFWGIYCITNVIPYMSIKYYK